MTEIASGQSPCTYSPKLWKTLCAVWVNIAVALRSRSPHPHGWKLRTRPAAKPASRLSPSLMPRHSFLAGWLWGAISWTTLAALNQPIRKA